jgi:hypothetical protein
LKETRDFKKQKGQEEFRGTKHVGKKTPKNKHVCWRCGSIGRVPTE